MVRNRVGFPADTWIATFGKVPDGPIIAEYLSFSFNFFGHWDFLNNAYMVFARRVPVLSAVPDIRAVAAHRTVCARRRSAVPLRRELAASPALPHFHAGLAVRRRHRRRVVVASPRLQLPSHTLLLGCAVLLAVAVAVSFFHKRLYYPPGVSDWTYLGLLAFPIVYLAAQISRPMGRLGGTLFRFAVSEGEASYSVSISTTMPSFSFRPPTC